MATSPLPAGPFSVRVDRPEVIGSADQVMIEEDAFRFGSATDTGSIEWFFTLPFSEIAELRYKPTGGRVSGTLEDGAELGFRIDQGLASEEAMRAVEALFHPEPEPDVESAEATVPGGGRPVEWPQFVEDAFVDAAECDAEPQVRRFARLTADAGLEMDWSRKQRRLDANLPGTKKTAFATYWIPKGRLNMGVYRTGGFGVGESEALRALPKIRAFHPMDPQETDRFLDALEVFLAARPLKDSPDHSKVSEIVGAPQEPTPRRLLVRSTQIVSDEELAEAMRSLEKRFEDAAQYGVESQARRFAELTAAADLDVRWNGRGLDAVWRRTQKPIFFLTWNDRGVKGGLGVDHGGDEFSRWSEMRAEEAFDWDPNRSSSRGTRSPGMEYTRKMDAAGTNHTTDLFLDWLQEFLAKHSIPSREAEAFWQTEDRLSNRGCGVVVLALSSIIWLGIVAFLLSLLPEGFFPWGEPIGWAIAGLLFLIVPVTAIVKGVAARREILAYNREHPDAKHFGTGLAWTAIIVAVLITAYALTLFLLRVT